MPCRISTALTPPLSHLGYFRKLDFQKGVPASHTVESSTVQIAPFPPATGEGTPYFRNPKPWGESFHFGKGASWEGTL